MSSAAQLQQDLTTQFDLYVGLLQKHEEANKRTYELDAEVARARSLQEQTTQAYERKLRTVREALQREEAQHAKLLKNMQDRIKSLQVKFDELHIEKQKEVAKNIPNTAKHSKSKSNLKRTISKELQTDLQRQKDQKIYKVLRNH